MDADIDQLNQIFLQECEDRLALFEESLIALEAHPTRLDLIDEIFRTAHTVKGSASSLGLDTVADFGHALEDLLERLRAGTLAVERGLISLLLEAADALRTLVPAAVAGKPALTPAQEALVKRLRSASCSSGASETPSSARAPPPVDEQPLQPAQARTLRIGVEKLDHLLNLVGQMSVASGWLGSVLERVPLRERQEALDAHASSERLLLELRELVTKARMVPIGPTFRKHQRTVRDIAEAQGKLARLVIEGAEVEVDMTLVELIADPLLHMLRNALDHGIESPAVRQERGKDPIGTLVLRASHQSGTVVVELIDDGGGLDHDKIAAKARSRGLVREGETPSREQLHQLIFAPGFSTADEITELSGRGVGMDVVRRNVEALHGTIALESVPGKGTRVILSLPLTMAIIEGFSVRTADECYVLPLESVVECLELPRDEGSNDDLFGVISLRGEPLPYLRLRHLFALSTASPARENLVVIEYAGGRAGIAVDALVGETQAVIKPLGKLFRNIPAISGLTILRDGRVAAMLDPGALAREAIRIHSRSFEAAQK